MMKNVFRVSVVALLSLLTVSCGTTQTASEALVENDYRNDVYRVIVNDQAKFTEFMQVVHNNDEAEKWLLKDHFQMMENGKMKEVMEKNPEMKEKMKHMMHEKMENDPEMQKKMMDKMKARMMEDPAMKEAMMENMHAKMKENPEMADKMMDKMVQFLHEQPELMEKMKAKMKAHQAEMEKEHKAKHKKKQ
jgi:hypothetical protein